MSAPSPRVVVTCTAPTNIATIKYWGKKVGAGVDPELNLPINSSVSVTLNKRQLRTVTTVALGEDFSADRLWLNGSEEDLSKNKRIRVVLREVRRRSAVAASVKVHIISENNFPTAAGLASSAAGYACLVSALAEAFGVKDSYPGELSTLARMGSGSACRSLYGGFVRWQRGDAADGSDSVAVQVAPADYWPELEVLVFVVSAHKKDTSSTDGMITSVQTSDLLKHRAEHVVPGRLSTIEAAYLARDFATFGQVTMADSNQFHACCLDTYPPIFYMNDVSRRIIRVVHDINAHAGRVVAAYTFDAGPNAVIFTLAPDTAHVLSVLLNHFPVPASSISAASPGLVAAAAAAPVPAALVCDADRVVEGAVSYVYHTTVGDGASVADAGECLADPATGMPL